MSLDTVVEDIRQEAQQRADEIQAEGEQKAEAIIADSETDAETLLEERKSEVERTIEREREQALSSANLEAKQERLEARRVVLDEVYEAVEQELSSLETEKKKELTASLIAAAADEFGTEEPIDVYGRVDEKEMIESILESYDKATYAGNHDCLGGIVVEGQRSRLRVNNTFDSLLEDVWEESLQDISDILFEQ